MGVCNNSAIQKVRSVGPYGIPLEKLAQLRACGRDSVTGWRVFLQTMFQFTCLALERMSREISDERSALVAVDFCRYLQNSGVIELLTRYCDSDQDFSRVKTLISDVTEQAGPYLRGGRTVKTPSVELGEVHDKLDAILAAVASPARSHQSTQDDRRSPTLGQEDSLPSRSALVVSASEGVIAA